MQRIRALSDSLLARFTEWFCSGGGVWETAIATLVLVIVELADRSLDPHAFALMAALTVYSAATQPALAHAGQQSAAKTEEVLARLELAEKRIVELLETKT